MKQSCEGIVDKYQFGTWLALTGVTKRERSCPLWTLRQPVRFPPEAS